MSLIDATGDLIVKCCQLASSALEWKLLAEESNRETVRLRAEVERLKRNFAEAHGELCENGHAKHGDCTRLCSCFGEGHSVNERLMFEIDDLHEEIDKLKTEQSTMLVDLGIARVALQLVERKWTLLCEVDPVAASGVEMLAGLRDKGAGLEKSGQA